ncbi:amidohydrolase family protein [Arthrobacter sp. ISL-95]|uniref:amidohydrolase family protein n=1 Tax=Arthrobacter sp. ISL-95 TaxID=2819116 RepID=UPI001BEB1952|nr:amidohydrolase family protein [Arthrobacter sp. ISL-95]MBT2587653.1 amidohydrolase family protein [Arthrobacter sp. ISL-95]
MNTSTSVKHLNTDEMLLLPELLLLPTGPVRDYAVVIADGIFREVGPASKLIAENPALSPVRLDHHLLMPGFVDTHHHLTQSFGKSMICGEPSEIFRRLWVPLEQHLDDESIYVASKLAALESLRGGFTTVCDAGTRASVDVGTVAAATQDVGLRTVLGYICNDIAPDGSSLDYATVMHAAERHLSRWDGGSLVHPSLAVSIPEAASQAVLRDTSLLAHEAGATYQVHLNEHLASVERSIERWGLRPLEYMNSVGALGPQTLAAHATLLTPYELRLLEETDCAVSYNPVASAWKGNAVAPALHFAERSIRFGIGTDGTRSDGFRLLDIAELAQRLAFGIQTGDSSCGGGWTWLHHATQGGAEAAGLGAVTGEIAVGKSADFLVLDWSVPEMQPSWDPSWELVRYANRDQIMAVVVAGKLRLWEGWPVEWDAQAFMVEAQEVAHRVMAKAPVRRLHPTATEHQLLRQRSKAGTPSLVG